MYIYFSRNGERLGCTIQESGQSRRADRASNGEKIRGRREGRGGREIGWSGKVRDGWVGRVGEREGGCAWEKEGERKREVGEQYLGDFALYLEMSFVGSISSTIRTLSLCPGVYRGVGSIRVYLCLQIDTRRTWVHPLPPFSLHFSLLSPSPVPPRHASPLSIYPRCRATQLCTNRIVATSISR